MPHEKELYRENLSALFERFGNKEIISLTDAARYIGVKQQTLRKIKGFPCEKNGNRYIVRVRRLASWLS